MLVVQYLHICVESPRGIHICRANVRTSRRSAWSCKVSIFVSASCGSLPRYARLLAKNAELTTAMHQECLSRHALSLFVGGSQLERTVKWGYTRSCFSGSRVTEFVEAPFRLPPPRLHHPTPPALCTQYYDLSTTVQREEQNMRVESPAGTAVVRAENGPPRPPPTPDNRLHDNRVHTSPTNLYNIDYTKHGRKMIHPGLLILLLSIFLLLLLLLPA